MDPDTFQMSLEKRAFTVERGRGNANAAGCHWLLWQIQDYVSFLPSLPDILPCLLTLDVSFCLCVCRVQLYWFLSEVLGMFSLLT